MSEMTARQISPKVTVSVVYAVAMFMTIMDTTIVNVALPTISRELSVPLDRVDGVSIGSWSAWRCSSRLPAGWATGSGPNAPYSCCGTGSS
jgi:MFS family permease